jgi:hypothetical protein
MAQEPFIADDVPATAQEYRTTFPDAKNLSDDTITNAVYQKGIETGKIRNQTLEDFKVGFLPNRPENNVDLYRQTFQDKFPELKTKTDGEIANYLWDYRTEKLGENLTQHSAPHFQKFLNTVAPKEYKQPSPSMFQMTPSSFVPEKAIINPSKTDVRKPVQGYYVDEYGPSYEDISKVLPNDNKYTIDEVANLTNVDLPNDVTDNVKSLTGPNLAASFGTGEQNKVIAMKNSLSKSIGIPPEQVQIRNGEKTGVYEFFNPKTQNWTLTNSSGLNAGDIGAFAGSVPEILANAYGTAVGATYGAAGGMIVGGPPGAVAGGLGGAFTLGTISTALGTVLRDAMGKWFFNTNQDTNSLEEGIKKLPEAAIIQAAGMSIPIISGIAKKLITTGGLEMADLIKIAGNAENAKIIQDKVNNEIAAAGYQDKLRYSLGQASKDPIVGAYEQALEKDPQYGLVGTVNSLNKDNANFLNALWALRNKSYGGVEFDPTTVGERVQSLLDNRIKSIDGQLAKIQAEREADLTNAVVKLPNGIQKEAGQAIQNTIQALQSQEAVPYEMRYSMLFGQGQGRLVNTDIIQNALNTLKSEQQNLFRTNNQSIVNNLNIPETQVIPLNRNLLQNAFNTLNGEQRYKLLANNPDFKDLMEKEYENNITLNKNLMQSAYEKLAPEQQNNFNKAFPKFNDLINSPNRLITVDKNELKNGIFALDKDSQNQFFKNSYIGLNKSLLSPQIVQADKQTIENILNSLNENDKIKFLSQYPDLKNVTEQNIIPLQQIYEARSDLNAKLKKIENGSMNDPVEAGTYKGILKSINQQLNSDFKGDPWIEQYNNISKDYNIYMKKFNRGIIGKLLTYKDGVPQIADEDVFKSTFKYGAGQQARINSVYNVIKDSPEAMQAYKNALLDFYRNKVAPDGNFNLSQHTTFMTQYKPSLETIFGKDNYPQISQMEGLQKAVQKSKDTLDDTRKFLSKSTYGTVSKMDPQDLFDKIYNPDKPQDFNKIVNYLRKNDSESLNALKTVVIDDMTAKTAEKNPLITNQLQQGINPIGHRTGSFDYVQFNKYLNTNKPLLESIFKDDPNYVKNLEEFNKILQDLSFKTNLSIGETNNALFDLIRNKIGMFNISIIPDPVKNVLNYSLKSRLNSIITDPKALDNLMSLKKVTTSLVDQAKYNGTVFQLFGQQWNPDWLPPQKESINYYGNAIVPTPYKQGQNNQNNKPKTNSPILNKISNEQSSLQNPVNTNITNPQLPNKDLFAMNVKPSGAGVTAGGMSSIPQGELAEAGALSRL